MRDTTAKWPEDADDPVDPAFAPLIEAGEGEATALAGAALLVPAGAAHAAAHDTTLVSRASGPAGASANAGSIAPPAVSADGRFVTFWSNATNLSPDDSDALYDLYRRDVASDATVLVRARAASSGPRPPGRSTSVARACRATAGWSRSWRTPRT